MITKFIKFPVYFHKTKIMDGTYKYFSFKRLNKLQILKLNDFLVNEGKISFKENFIKEPFWGKIKDIVLIPKILFCKDRNLYCLFLKLELIEIIGENDFERLLSNIERELSDGWGEGIEQEPFYIDEIDNEIRIEYYLHVRYSKNWELEIVETIENS